MNVFTKLLIGLAVFTVGLVVAAPGLARPVLEDVGVTTVSASQPAAAIADTTTDATTDNTTTAEDTTTYVNPPAPADCATEERHIATDQEAREHGYTPNPDYYYIKCNDGSVIAILNGVDPNCCV